VQTTKDRTGHSGDALAAWAGGLADGKARAAALFKKPSQELEEAINRGRYAAITARGFIEMQGALPVVVDGEVIGAIGASFATPEQDVQVAQAELAALGQ
jgi:glc operon protein GlcG